MAFPRSGTVDTQTFSGTKDFVAAHSSALQNSNISANDHLKLDTVDVARGGLSSGAGAASGGAVILDTTTTYSNTDGAASLGRFSLKAGKTYKLTCHPGYFLFSGATGVITLQWYDVGGAAAAIGQPLNVYVATDASNDGATGSLVAFFQPGTDTLVEVRIAAVTALTSIGNTAKGLPVALVETY
jgi:hypothetical protein